MILHVICTSFQRPIQQRILIDSFILQSNPIWKLYIIHDGPASEMMKEVIDYYDDARIKFIETPTVSGHYGHPNKQRVLSMIPHNHKDFVLMTNDDNYYVPKFVEYMTARCRSLSRKIGMVYCDTVHSYTNYEVLITQVKENYIDMGSFIVRNDIAKKVGFANTHLSADGTYAEACAVICRKLKLEILHIPKPLFVHN